MVSRCEDCGWCQVGVKGGVEGVGTARGDNDMMDDGIGTAVTTDNIQLIKSNDPRCWRSHLVEVLKLCAIFERRGSRSCERWQPCRFC